MKNEFFGFYEASSAEIDKSWKESYFVFDANTLLNLYRYSDSTRKDFLLAIHQLKENLFMPYQVGFEYHSNRLSVIETLNSSYVSLENSINEIFDKQIQSQLNQYKRHPSIDVESLLELQNEFLQKFSNELEKQQKEHPDFISDDEVLNELTILYENKVGKPFSKEELKRIYLEGKDRYEQLIPPGYKDLETKRKKGDQHVYGDLIIWKEIIALAKKDKKSIIFVTDDRKEDWWAIENGKTIRPREELVKEFYDLTGIRILIYNADSFLHHAKERNLVSTIKDASIDEVKEVRKSDENFNTLSEFLNSDLYKSRFKIDDYINSSSKVRDILNLDADKSSFRISDFMESSSKMKDFVESSRIKDLMESSRMKNFVESSYITSNILNPKINKADRSLSSLQYPQPPNRDTSAQVKDSQAKSSSEEFKINVKKNNTKKED